MTAVTGVAEPEPPAEEPGPFVESAESADVKGSLPEVWPALDPEFGGAVAKVSDSLP